MNLILNRTILFILGILVFILPIAHTIAIRNISFFLILLIVLYLFFKKKIYKRFKFEMKFITLILSIFTLWLFIVAFFISDETSWSLGEIKREWIVPLLYFITFVLLGLYSLKEDKIFTKNIYLVIFSMLFIHVLYIDIYAIKFYMDTKTLMRFAGLTEGPDKSNYITNIVLAFLVSEVIYRFRTAKKILNISNIVLAIFIFLTLFSSILEGMRNGAVAILFLGFTGTYFSLYGNKRFSKKLKMFISLLLFGVLIIPSVYNLKNDKRWSKLIDTIPYALNTQVNKHWLNDKKYPLPKFHNGENVEASAYLRVAWGYEGIKLILENPLGIGYARNAFSHGIEKKYNEENNVGHSHSGIIDLAIGVGIPGVMIWLGFGLFLMYLSYSYFIKTHSFYALILFFNVSGFFSRFIVDSNMRDHMFQTFMLIVGFSLTLMLKDKHLKNEKY